MTVVQLGQVNTTSLVVPDVVVQIVPPQQNYVNGVATNILGLVGTATWGPVNSPTIIGDIKQYPAAQVRHGHRGLGSNPEWREQHALRAGDRWQRYRGQRHHRDDRYHHRLPIYRIAWQWGFCDPGGGHGKRELAGDDHLAGAGARSVRQYRRRFVRQCGVAGHGDRDQ